MVKIETKEQAHILLKEKQPPKVWIACLNLLGVEAVDFVRHQLQKEQWYGIYYHELKAAILRIPIDDAARRNKAMEILFESESHYRPLVMAALMVFHDEPHMVTGYCMEIAKRWNWDMQYYIDHDIPKYSTHLIKAMSHPQLLGLTKMLAKKMIRKESKVSGFLDRPLHDFAQKFLMGDRSSWDEVVGE